MAILQKAQGHKNVFLLLLNRIERIGCRTKPTTNRMCLLLPDQHFSLKVGAGEGRIFESALNQRYPECFILAETLWTLQPSSGVLLCTWIKRVEDVYSRLLPLFSLSHCWRKDLRTWDHTLLNVITMVQSFLSIAAFLTWLPFHAKALQPSKSPRKPGKPLHKHESLLFEIMLSRWKKGKARRGRARHSSLHLWKKAGE